MIFGARKLHCVSKSVTNLFCYNIDIHESVLIIFRRSVTEKVSNRKMFYFRTLPNLCFCTTLRNAEIQKLHLLIQMLYYCIACHTSTSRWLHLLWPPYEIGAIIFLPCGYYLSFYLSIFFISSPNLSGRRLDVYHTSTHGVALV